MKPAVLFACAAFCLVVSAPARSQAPGGDVATAPSAAPKTPGRADAQQDAEAAFERAKAQCRRAEKGDRLDCVKRAQRDYDKTQRVVKPPRRPPPSEPIAKP